MLSMEHLIINLRVINYLENKIGTSNLYKMLSHCGLTSDMYHYGEDVRYHNRKTSMKNKIRMLL